jgi:hypothetical protein
MKELQAERLLVAQQGIEDGKELSHTGGESHLLHFAAFQQLLVLGSDQWIVARGHQGGHVEHTAYIGPTSLGLAVTAFLATVIIHGCHTHQGCNLLAINFAQLGQFCEQSGGGHWTHTRGTGEDLTLLLPGLLLLEELLDLLIQRV